MVPLLDGLASLAADLWFAGRLDGFANHDEPHADDD